MAHFVPQLCKVSWPFDFNVANSCDIGLRNILNLNFFCSLLFVSYKIIAYANNRGPNNQESARTPPPSPESEQIFSANTKVATECCVIVSFVFFFGFFK